MSRRATGVELDTPQLCILLVTNLDCASLLVAGEVGRPDTAAGPSSSDNTIVPAAGDQDSPDADDAEIAASDIAAMPDDEGGHRGEALSVALNHVEHALSQFMERQPNEHVRQHLQGLQYNVQAFKRMTAGEQINTSEAWRTLMPFASDSDDDDLQSDEQSSAAATITPVHKQRAGPARIQFPLPIRASIPILLFAVKPPNSPPTVKMLKPSDVSPEGDEDESVRNSSRSHC